MNTLTQFSRLTVGLTTVTIVLLATRPAEVPPVPTATPPSGAAARALFDELVRNEPQARTQVLDDWAHHRWSQQDAFSAIERDRVLQLARERHLTTQDVLRVLDDGLRAGWPGPDGKPLLTATVPLKPRPMD
jgi:hypothetical protein